MANFSVGDMVRVPCSIQQGPFQDEKLITVETMEGLISGFVKVIDLKLGDDSEHGFVKGIVVGALPSSMKVQISGSFFTTAQGVASVSSDRLTRLEAA